ncbi:MAG: hypothetical protein HYY61_00880 [Deltaproteobacteria bacterium]|nr:hypothetical protein [Deltaproteobacteria bacterium]
MRKTFLWVLLGFMVSFQLMAATTTKKVIAHRGLSGTYPENTMVSFKRALETKAEFMELDVHLSKDDQVVVMHDEDLSRTTNATGLIGTYPLVVLKTFSAGFLKKFGYKFYKEKVPTLLEVLKLIEKSRMYLLIEIKSHDKDPQYNERVGQVVYEAVMKNTPQLKDRVAFISFNVEILEKIRALDKTVRLGPIFNELPKEGSLADQALKLDTDVVVFSKKLLSLQNVIEKTDQVKHFIYTVMPPEFAQVDQVDGLYGFATDYADQID